MVARPSFDEARARAVRLAQRTSLGVGGAPELHFEPRSLAEAAEVVGACREAGVALRVLGAGCNLLVGDATLPGAVLATHALRGLTIHEDRVEAAAGHPFPDLVRRSVELSIPALPGCPGIPGSVGGVVFMNAGGRFGSVAEAVIEVQGLDPAGEPFRRRVTPADFGYRLSPFVGCVITGAVFRRVRDLDPKAQRALLDEAQAWKRATQPLWARSAGCIFKNPDGPAGAGSAGRPSAGRLIDEAGLKGLTVGGAQVSPVHANFIVNVGGATAADVDALIERVREVVAARHGVTLELEVCRWT